MNYMNEARRVTEFNRLWPVGSQMSYIGGCVPMPVLTTSGAFLPEDLSDAHVYAMRPGCEKASLFPLAELIPIPLGEEVAG